MNNSTYKFDIPKHHKSIIKVIGVGGGGSNALNHMYNQGIKDVEFIVCNTDAQALNGSPIPNKLQLGIHLTEGLGAGANPEIGREAAVESKEDIREMLSHDTKMVFITAGMGGGTGTGAAPVIAKISKELDILTVGIVTAPFAFEGKKKILQAEQGIRELKENCDTVLVILNDNLREIYGNLSITQAFSKADNILLTAAKGIAEIITVPGDINVDFEDVKTTMENSGAAIMGSAQTEGENRALMAAQEALASPLLDNKDINGAQKILLSIISGEEAELQMDELSEITNYIQEKAGDDAQVIFGHGCDSALGKSIRVTVIATGFVSNLGIMETDIDSKKIFDLESNRQITLFTDEKDKEPKFDYFNDQPRVPQDQDEEKDILASGALSENEEPEEEEIMQPNKLEYGFTGGSVKVKDEESETESGNEMPGPFLTKEEDEEKEEIIHHTLEERIEEEVTGVLHNKGFKSVEFNNQDDEFITKREKLQMEAKRRSMELKSNDLSEINSEKFKNLLEVPAYERKNVRLQNVPHSSEKNISRFNLDDEFTLSKNNPYLHDRPD